ncbi:MAG TPA: ATP-dependent DNA helicase [Gammaproteobacteria bacterium]|nr:ATP-dependent DNA helicase [Gammaproteobacteria bacterium]
MQTIVDILGPDGPLAKHVPGFASRRQQQDMAEATARALENNEMLIAEAGTGTGKTYAYLVPALLCGKKVMISTGTKNLQDQLFHRDLPTVRKALGVSTSVALLKGRANYLCHHRLALVEGRRLRPEQQDQLARIRTWLGRTTRGDIAELSAVPEDASIWPKVTSTADNCLGGECPVYSDCFVVKARKNAQSADVLVVNHHLFFADLALRDEGFGELLPSINAFIFDEAHQLPDVASVFFGNDLSARQLNELARDALVDVLTEAPDASTVQASITRLEKTVRDFRLALGNDTKRAPWASMDDNAALATATEDLVESLARLTSDLEPLAERGKGLDRSWRRCLELKARLDQFVNGGSDEQGVILWFETHARGFALHMTPLEISETFRSHVDKHKSAWIFTSATLAVGDDFTHFSRELGIEDAHARRWDSPFDFTRQALLYVPTALPPPNTPDYTAAVIDAARPVIEASGGRAFFLLTSYRALNIVARALEGKTGYPLLVQGSLPRGELLDRFREQGNAILVGTSSFWEGVDVRGEALSCVIIDKLPFSSPGDPVMQARLEAMRERGLNPFFDYQVPQAAIALKQGVGRLIRDVSDRGVLMICDPRLFGKSYGRIFRNSLPSMPVSRDVADVQKFFASEQKRGMATS